jgi:3-methyladenine DNA glycosylase
LARSAQLVAPALIGCLLVKRQASGDLLWGVVVETEAYFQDDPACHGYRRPRAVSYGIHHCVNVVLPHPTSGAQPCRIACASLQPWQRRLRWSPWPIRP